MKNHLVLAVDRARQGFKRTRSGSMSTSQLHLVPPELWIQIFSYLTTPLDVKAVSLTCQSFRQFAQPLLFTKIYTHPAPPAMALRGLQANKYRRRTSQRLEFFLSPLIAPAVRECWIDPPSAEDDDLPTDVLIDAIFDGLCNLPNLKVVGCHAIRLTSNRLAVLRRLTLTNVTLESCLSDLTDFSGHSPMPFSTVTLRYPDVPPQEYALSPLFSLFLSPRHLHRLTATSTDILPVIAGGRFTRLVQLEVAAECLTSDLFIVALSHCPALERITLQVGPEGHILRTGVPSALPENILPNIKFYRGPRNYVALFASTGRLQTIEISVPAKVHRLLRTFGQLKCPLDYLSFRVDGQLPKTLLESVHKLFPTLRTLSVNDPAVSTPELQALLHEASPCPSTRVFRIRVEARDRYNLWIPPMEEATDALDCYKKLHAEIERVFPNLSTLKIMYGLEGASVVWKRSADSRKLVQITATP
ncbi:hypothetical protein B0H16DRAFT_1623165 [Mycena metata]|uniref:F-box domain-containing protein n=1 Tax=Mycena metata TaxID=1033252 RepID=A0AAD7H6X9_9AGAR|nr:hypothetical protein B0H16DRAFT_1623165 [Mycena metata]